MTDRNYYLHDGVGRSGDVVIREVVTQIRTIRTAGNEAAVIQIGRDSYRCMVGHLQECSVLPPGAWPPTETGVLYFHVPVDVQDEGFGIHVLPVAEVTPPLKLEDADGSR